MSHSMSNGPEFQRLGYAPSQILMKLFQVKSIYEIKEISTQTDGPFKSYDTSKLAP